MTLRQGLLLTLCLSGGLPACDDDEVTILLPDASSDAAAPDGGGPDAMSERDATIADVDAANAAQDAQADVDGNQFFDSGFPATALNLTTAASFPTCTHAGPAASGSAIVSLGPDDAYLTISYLSWQNLSSAVTGAHVHYGASGTAGPVVIPLSTAEFGAGGSGSAMNYQAAQGAPPTFAAFVQELKVGKAYINVHTTSCSDGEIRAQIVLH
jgi:hypothetical protein